MSKVVDLYRSDGSREIKKVLDALEAEEDLQRIIERHDGGRHDLYTRGFDPIKLRHSCRRFRQMNNFDKQRFASQLAKTRELAIG